MPGIAPGSASLWYCNTSIANYRALTEMHLTVLLTIAYIEVSLTSYSTSISWGLHFS